jgi:hypothetical protein
MGQAWVEDSKRPGGVGRAERERVFWERVASGRRSLAPGNSQGTRRRDAPRDTKTEIRPESGWESARVAVVTMLTVIVFGLGWVSLELESATGASDAKGYDWSLRGSPTEANLLAQSERAGSE